MKIVKTIITGTLLMATSMPLVTYAQQTQPDSTSVKQTLNKLGERFNLNLLFRSSLNYGAKMVGNEKAANLNVDEARLEIVGKVMPNLTYRFRYRMQRSPLPTTSDGANNALDIAYVQYRFAKDKMEIVAGKQGALFGSYEFITNPTFEYKYTDMVNSIVNIFPKAITLKTYVNNHHNFALQIYNTTNNTFEQHNANLSAQNVTGLSASRVPLGAHLSWNGNFADGRFSTLYSAGLNSYAAGKAGANFALGHQYKAGKIWAYLDLFQANLPVDYTGLSNSIINKYYYGINTENYTLAKDITYRTAVMRFDYLLSPKWNLSLKGFVETASKAQDKNFGNNYRQNLGYLTALEYKPFADQSLKFFANYCGQNISYRNAAATVAKNTDANIFSVGFLWYVNPFKF